MKFLCLLDSNSTAKSISLLYCRSDIENPDIQDTVKFIAWFEALYDKDPGAFRIDLVQKSAFNLDAVENLENLLLNQTVILETDIYKRYLFNGDTSVNQIQMNRIEPCTPVHLKKYIKGEEKRVEETPQVLPYIQSIPLSRTEWIRKVLNKEAEQEAVLYHDTNPNTGFILLPDSKWDQQQVSQLYLLAIAQDSSIKSLRDLRAEHLAYLKNMRAEILNILGKRFQLTWRDVRFVIHYQPSYYHFHVHVVNVKIKGLDGLLIGQCHLLEDVIEHLEIDPEYYVKRSLVYALNSVHPLFEGLQQLVKMEDDEEHYRKLKISLHKSIGTMANSENIKLTPESHLAMVELVFEQCKMFGFDLEAFANHGKRMTINGDDVRLLLRRHPDLLKDL